MSRKTTLSTGFAVATIALFALTGCGSAESGTTTNPAPVSSAPAEQSPEAEAPAGDQSKADACKLVSDLGVRINEVNSGLSDAVQSQDVGAARELVAKVGDEFDTVSAEITNADIAPLFTDWATAWDGFETVFTELAGAIDSKDTAALSDAGTKLSESSTALVDSGTALAEACNAG